MNTTAKGLLIILVVGFVILIAAALADRRSRQRAEGRLAKTPDDGPAYVTASELARRSVATGPVDPSVKAALANATALALTLVTPDLATNNKQVSVAADAAVLVCADPVLTVRELLPVLAVLPPGRPLVVAAPSLEPSVIDVLSANNAAQTRVMQPISGQSSDLAQLADIAGAPLVSRTDLQAGAVGAQSLGRLALSVAGANGTQVLGSAAPQG